MTKQNVLLSFPRSGRNWIAYFVKALSKQPIAGHVGYDVLTENFQIDETKNNILVLVHRGDHPWDSWNKENCNLLLLLRNYKEAIIRHINFVDDSELIQQCVEGYLHCIDFYDKFDGNKLIVYYEDLILQPKVEIDKILTFLNISKEHCYEEFFKNFAEHQKMSVKLYHGGSITKGDPKNLTHHSKYVGPAIVNKIAKLIKQNKGLYNKYLKRYS